MDSFKQETDKWIKNHNARLNELEEFTKTVTEAIDNINMNYELINEIKSELEHLKSEMDLMRLVQIMTMKDQVKEKNYPKNLKKSLKGIFQKARQS